MFAHRSTRLLLLTRFLLLAVSSATLAGCDLRTATTTAPPAAPTTVIPAPSMGGSGAYGYGVTPDQIKFHDNVQSNATADASPGGLQFVGTQGEPLDLKSFEGKKNLVVVVTRGGVTPPCVYCSTQTSRLIAQYGEIAKRDAEVVVVFPVVSAADKVKYDAFTAALSREIKGSGSQKPIPFPIVIDVDLKATSQLNIRGDLAKPATYILDKDGKVRFAYIGAHLADRPSVKAILDQLDAFQQSAP